MRSLFLSHLLISHCVPLCKVSSLSHFMCLRHLRIQDEDTEAQKACLGFLCHPYVFRNFCPCDKILYRNCVLRILTI